MINISRRLFIILFPLLECFSITRITLGSPCIKVTDTDESQGTSTPPDSSQQAAAQRTGKRMESKVLWLQQATLYININYWSWSWPLRIGRLNWFCKLHCFTSHRRKRSYQWITLPSPVKILTALVFTF